MSKVVTFRPITPQEDITYALKCSEVANEQSKMQCPRPINVAMVTSDDADNSEITSYLCRGHALAKRNAVAQSLANDENNYGLKAEDNV